MAPGRARGARRADAARCTASCTASASAYLRNERSNHTLQPTALVNEAYVRLTSSAGGEFANRVHFYGAAATAMRRILVDHARRQGAQKRGDGASRRRARGRGRQRGIDPQVDFSLSTGAQRLAELSPIKERVVELRYFGGLSVEETAEVLDMAPVTVKRHWAFARVWLYRELGLAVAARPPRLSHQLVARGERGIGLRQHAPRLRQSALVDATSGSAARAPGPTRAGLVEAATGRFGFSPSPPPRHRSVCWLAKVTCSWTFFGSSARRS